jgi:GT2 family glycosyltransferase
MQGVARRKPSDDGGDAGRVRPGVSVIVVSWNTREILRACLTSIESHLAEVNYETIVVENGSSDGSAEMVRSNFPRVRLVQNGQNLGFGVANNVGMSLARADVFLLLNSDARLVDDTPLRLIGRLRCLPKVGVIGPTLRFEDGRLQASAHRFGSLGRLVLEELLLYKLLSRARVGDLLLGGYWNHDVEREVDWVTGACMLVRREVFEETGGFDPRIFLYGEEVEWCQRIRAVGWSIVFSPVGEVKHIGHASTDLLLGDEGRVSRCLTAGDRLIRLRQGEAAGFIAPWIRVAGALLRLSVLNVGLFRDRDDPYSREVRRHCRVILRHYLRRRETRDGHTSRQIS